LEKKGEREEDVQFFILRNGGGYSDHRINKNVV
jgi:hypothetical protein